MATTANDTVKAQGLVMNALRYLASKANGGKAISATTVLSFSLPGGKVQTISVTPPMPKRAAATGDQATILRAISDSGMLVTTSDRITIAQAIRFASKALKRKTVPAEDITKATNTHGSLFQQFRGKVKGEGDIGLRVARKTASNGATSEETGEELENEGDDQGEETGEKEELAAPPAPSAPPVSNGSGPKKVESKKERQTKLHEAVAGGR